MLTTLELLGDAALLARATPAVRVGNGLGMVVRLGTTALPRYPVGGRRARRRTPRCSCSRRAAPSLRAAHGEFTAGRTPTEPAVLLMTLQRARPDHRAAGQAQHHRVGAVAPVRAVNRRAAGTTSASARRDKIVAQVEQVAPGFSDSIEHVHVQTPLDLERELGLRRGNVMHVEMGLDSMFMYRPLPELAGYRTPVRGLFLTGASTHPGGGVFGASGRTAARVVLAAAAAVAMSIHRRTRVRQQPPAAVGRAGARPDRGCWLPPTVGLADRLPAGRRSVAAPRHHRHRGVLRRDLRAARAGAPRPRLGARAGRRHGGGGLAAEAVGVRTGLPVRRLPYAGTLGPEVLDVPLVVPLAWTMMAYPVLLAARRLTRRWAPLVGGSALAAWDVFLDPQMVGDGPLDLGRPGARRCPACPASR